MIPNEIILNLAYNSIKSAFKKEELISKFTLVKNYPEFVIPVGTFVTINKNGRLRGCIGSLVAHQELYNDIVINAQKAAFKDPRFPPLKEEELSDISLEVSILTPAVKVDYIDFEDLCKKIEPFVDGLILKNQTHQGTYLPQVWEQIPKVEDFLKSLCKKSGMDTNCFSQKPEIYKYQVQKVK